MTALKYGWPDSLPYRGSMPVFGEIVFETGEKTIKQLHAFAQIYQIYRIKPDFFADFNVLFF